MTRTTRAVPRPRSANRFLRRALIAAGMAASVHASLPAHAGSVSYSYDALGRLASAVYSTGSSTTTISYSYDAAGNRSAVVTTSP